MAIITTTLVPTISIFPWSDASGQTRTVQPVAELTAILNLGAVALTGVGDTQLVIADFELPQNFSYVLTDATAMIRVAGLPAANNWDLLGSLVVLDGANVPAAQTKRYSLGWTSPGPSQFAAAQSDITYTTIVPPPTFQTQGLGFYFLRWFNVTTNEPAATVSMTMRFLQYTIGQVYDSGVNTPMLTR